MGARDRDVGLDTAFAHHLARSDRTHAGSGAAAVAFGEILRVWGPTNAVINAIAESLGTAPIYPFGPTGVVVDKLDFVPRQGTDRVARYRFYEAT